MTAVGSLNQETAQFILKKLIKLEGKQKYHADVSNGFAYLEDLDTKMEINSAKEAIRAQKLQSKRIQVIMSRSISHCSMKDAQNYYIMGKQSKVQRLQDPSRINGDNLNNVRCEASRHFKNNRVYFKDKIK
jgi:hypothetical protein